MTAPHLALSTSFQDSTILGPHRRFSMETDDPETVVKIVGGSGTGDTTDGVPICVLSGAKPTGMTLQIEDSSAALKYVLLQGTAPDAIWADGESTSSTVAAENAAYTPGTSGDWDTPPTKADDAFDELAGRVKDLEVSNETAQYTIPIDIFAGLLLATGAPMAVFADGASSVPGVECGAKGSYVRWNNHATPAAIVITTPMPQDINDAADVVVHALVSKVGATVGDATKLTIGAYEQVVGALWDADTDFGGDSSAVTGNATSKTLAEITLTLALADIHASPQSITLAVKPKAGTLGTDDFCLHAMWFEATRKALTA